MTYKRGAIYLANFNPSNGSEPGKVRPCLILQSDALNDANHQTTGVLPLTTRLMDDAHPIRYTINARDSLQRDSQVRIDQFRTIDVQRFTSGVLTVLQDAELAEVEDCLKIVLGLSE